MTTPVIAVDFGATSIRVCRVGIGDHEPQVQVVHRHTHQPRRDRAGTLRWDWERLVAEMLRGLELALSSGPAASIGIDTWAVDYGLLDDRGRLIAPPVSYRDDRTDGSTRIIERIGADRFFGITGLQVQPFNTIFQLAAHDRDELRRARHLLLLPELLCHHLTGAVVAERTSAGCTGLVDIEHGTWSAELLGEIGIGPSLFPAILPATTPVGSWRGTPVHLVAGHDTASAVVGMGAEPGPGVAFAATGTWFLVGQERPSADLSAAARAANLSNEVGAMEGFRLLKNLAGGWLIEQCRPAWGNPPVAAVISGAADQPSGPTFDVSDPRFLNPASMVGEIAAVTGLGPDADPAVITRCIIDSIADGVADVLNSLGAITRLQLFGGASRWAPLIDRIEQTGGVAVGTGPLEASSIGNALVQGVAVGTYRDLAEARRSASGLPR